MKQISRQGFPPFTSTNSRSHRVVLATRRVSLRREVSWTCQLEWAAAKHTVASTTYVAVHETDAKHERSSSRWHVAELALFFCRKYTLTSARDAPRER